jgi:hypothetical protein
MTDDNRAHVLRDRSLPRVILAHTTRGSPLT